MSVTIKQGDVRDVLKTLPANHFDCIVTSPPYWGLRSYLPDAHEHKGREIGLEPTLKEYIETMVGVCEELRRVLKPTGTFWLNIGDSYSGSNIIGRNDAGRNFTGGGGNKEGSGNPGYQGKSERNSGLKSKDLCMVPNRLAICLQDAGWYVRSEIIWEKPSCMPESVTDRPTQSMEKVWLLTKSPTYFYDAFAVAEKAITGDMNAGPRNYRAGSEGNQRKAAGQAVVYGRATRNLRNVWKINPRPFIGAHYATMPPELVERCILAGSSAGGCCPHCGSPYERIIEKGEPLKEWQEACGADSNGEYHGTAQKGYIDAGVQNASDVKARVLAGMVEKKSVGWRKTCKCEDAEPVNARVLDPFGGSGTTGMVADSEGIGRDAVLIELNPSYVGMSEDRIRSKNPVEGDIKVEI